jgi:hypothetical protein
MLCDNWLRISSSNFIQLKHVGSAWTSSIHIPTSDIPIQNPNSRSFSQFVTSKSDYKLTSTQTCQPNPWLTKWTTSTYRRTLMLRPQDHILITSAPPIFQWLLRLLLVEEIFATTLTTKFHQCVIRAVSPRTCGDFSRQLDEDEAWRQQRTKSQGGGHFQWGRQWRRRRR